MLITVITCSLKKVHKIKTALDDVEIDASAFNVCVKRTDRSFIRSRSLNKLCVYMTPVSQSSSPLQVEFLHEHVDHIKKERCYPANRQFETTSFHINVLDVESTLKQRPQLCPLGMSLILCEMHRFSSPWPVRAFTFP